MATDPKLSLGVPPQGQTNISIRVKTVAHGWNFVGAIRNLGRRGHPRIAKSVFPYTMLWIHLSQYLLERGIGVEDLRQALSDLPARGDPN